jgi:hypothetical protein
MSPSTASFGCNEKKRHADPARAIVVSGYPHDPVMERYADHGFRGRLVKPFLAEDLARVLGEVLHP